MNYNEARNNRMTVALAGPYAIFCTSLQDR